MDARAMVQAFSLQAWANMWDGIFSSGGHSPLTISIIRDGTCRPFKSTKQQDVVNLVFKQDAHCPSGRREGEARAMFGSPLEAFDSARAAMLSRCSRPQPQTARPAQGSVEGHAPAEVRSILACCET